MKKITLFAVIVFLICGIFGSAFTSVAFAAATSIETSDVLDDLTNSKIAGEEFNPDNYGYTNEREPIVLSFSEYGFAFNKSDKDYNIYIYLYNPSGQEIKAQRNSITVATVYENGSAVDYDKFAIKLLSVSDGKYARLFYKFKIADPTKLHTRVAANTKARRYDVSEIELNFGDVTSKAYAVGNYWEYSGYAQGYGADSKADSSLACVSDSIETLKLDVKSTFYRYNNGVNKQSDLSSVYFGVPNDIFTKYGTLQQIKANWFETKTTQQVILSDRQIYNNLYQYLGVSTSEVEIPIGVHEDGHNYDALRANNSKGAGQFCEFYFDGKYHEINNDKNWELGNDNNYINKLQWLFYSDNGYVSANEVLYEAKNYSSRFGDDLLIDKYSKDLFVEEVDIGRQYGWQGVDKSGLIIDANSKFDINGFDAGSDFENWFANLIYKDLENETLKDITPIYIVKDSDILGSASTIAKRLYIEESDVTEFLEVYNQNKVEGRKTVLFRFAVTDYVAYDLYTACENWISKFYDIGYVAQQTVFLDFDIIWLKFLKAGQSTVIPCVSSPIDVFHGLTPPLEPSVRNLWAIIVAVVVVVLLLIVCFKLFGVAFKKRNKGGKR